MIKNYDPNNDYRHKWKVKLQQGEYFGEIEVICGGNTHGIETLDAGIGFYVDEHESVILIDKKENTCEIEFFGDEDELKKIVVGAELIGIDIDE